MHGRLFQSLGLLVDPLRSPRAAERWIAALPAFDPDALQQRVLQSVGPFARERDFAPARVEALLKVDARLEALITALTDDYTASYDKNSDTELRVWQLVFDLIKVF